MAYKLADGSLSTDYKVGDRFVVLQGGSISIGSIVKLYKDDGTNAPMFKVIEGSSNFKLCGGKAGACTAWYWLKPVNKPTLFQRIKKVIKQWLSN